ncbi:MAG: acyl-CoA thioester hydrolase [Variibacter sp.]|jgi:acyl-CoA thioester hydrolase|nr:acyl-CoA thioester hydrolase [Variibacter sp.]
MRDGRHLLSVRVYYEDTDFSGVVYHASYLRFMERGRTEFLRQIGVDHRAMFEGETAVAFVVRAMQIEFLKAARMDDVLTIETAVSEVRGASIMMRQQVGRGDETLVTAELKIAMISGGRAQRLPPSIRDALTRAAGAENPR